MKYLVAGVLAVLCMSTVARAELYPHELYGFLLRQSADAVDGTMGKSFEQGTKPDGSTYRAYRLPHAKDTYLVAVSVDEKIETLELTGTDFHGETGFSGLHLGDSAAAIEKLLGKPATIRHEDDVNVDLWDYKPSNFSLEFSPGGKLYSIQIVDDTGKYEDLPGLEYFQAFATAVVNADIDSLMEMSSGELECGNSTLVEGFEKQAARRALMERSGKMRVCLNKAAKAILAASPAMKKTNSAVRIYEKGSPGTVTKFPESSPLREIVFSFETGKWRFYEVTFRR